MLQRDVVINEINNRLRSDKDIYFLSADFGSASLDLLRKDYKENFIHCGISEQAMIDIAVGLALQGKKVFCYAMAPFISLRALEQIKCGPGLMSLPITIIGVGIGLGYADSGPTHYVTEDFACMRTMVGMNIYTPSDNESTKKIIKKILRKPEFSYLRLDREEMPELGGGSNEANLEYKIFQPKKKSEIALISHGYTSHLAYKAYEKNKDVTFIDLSMSKPLSSDLVGKLKKFKRIIVVDEQMQAGGLSSLVYETLSTNNANPIIQTVSLKEAYTFENGGRKYLLKKNGISVESILKKIG
jgi:transketolase